MVLSVLLATSFLQQAQKLADFPEWSAYSHALRGQHRYQLTFNCDALAAPPNGVSSPREGSLLVDGKRMVVDLPRTRDWWDGRTHTSLDKLTNKLTADTTQPNLGPFSLFGIPNPENMGAWQPTSWTRLRAESTTQGKSTVETGLRGMQPWVDTRQDFEMWFDTESHLLARVITSTGGMQPHTRSTYHLFWDLKPSFSSDSFTPKRLPPSDSNEFQPTTTCRFAPSASPVLGFGTLVVTVPPGTSVNLEIDRDSSPSHLIVRGLSREFASHLSPGPHILQILGATFIATIHEGIDTIVALGAIRGRNEFELVNDKGVAYNWVPRGSVLPVIPGSYRVRVGKQTRMVTVRQGEIRDCSPMPR